MIGGKWVYTEAGPCWVPGGWRIHVSKPWIHSHRRKPSTVQYTIYLTPPRSPKDYWRKRKEHARHHRHTTYFAPFSRYREKDLDAGTFLLGRGSTAITPSTVMGTSYVVRNGKRTSTSLNHMSTGSKPPSLNIRKTWDQTNPGPPYHGGGPFRSMTTVLPASKKVGFGRYTNEGNTSNPANVFSEYIGSFIDDGVWQVGESYSDLSLKGFSNFPSLSSYHQAAWDKTKPQVPQWNAGQFIYELKDLPGQMATTAELFARRWADIAPRNARKGVMVPYMSPREAADQFLNEEFGWAPFIGDFIKLFNAWNDSVNKMAKIIGDNGHWVRKRRVLEESDEIGATLFNTGSGTIPNDGMTDPNGNNFCRIMDSPLGICQGYRNYSSRVRKRTWAVGSFKFYRPEFDQAFWDDNSYNTLLTIQRLISYYGLRISPTLLWKITPWTWTIDWFTGFGKYIERLDDFVQDGIVSRYLYVMRTEEQFLTKTSVLNFFSGPLTLNFQRRFTMKQREPADSPYGFNAPWSNLSLRQWAILGAIGISRSGAGYITHGS